MAPTPAPPPVHPATARAVLLVRAFETGDPDPGLWTAEDRAWASRCARESLGSDASPWAWLACRAEHAVQRLRPRDPRVAAALAPRSLPWHWLLPGALLALALGLAVDQIGPAQRIQLLAPPVWALLAWNLGIYLLLLVQALRPAASPAPWLRRVLAAALQARAPAARPDAVWPRFLERWLPIETPIRLAQAAAVLHLAAALLALGVVAGLYLRGLVLDYRVAWESTFLDAGTVHRLLALALAPAQALSGVPVPDAAAVAALRTGPGQAATASAAPWLHLYAATLALGVIGPRLLLAAVAAGQAGWRARRCRVPLDEPYFQALLPQAAAGGPPGVTVLGHGQALDPAAVLKLRALLQAALGAEPALELPPPLPYGEDPPALPLGTRWLLVLDMASTPEPEVHGRLVAALRRQAPGAHGLVLVDEGAWAARMAAYPQRVAERRQAWQHWAQALHLPLMAVTLQAPAPTATAALRDALAGP